MFTHAKIGYSHKNILAVAPQINCANAARRIYWEYLAESALLIILSADSLDYKTNN